VVSGYRIRDRKIHPLPVTQTCLHFGRKTQIRSSLRSTERTCLRWMAGELWRIPRERTRSGLKRRLAHERSWWRRPVPKRSSGFDPSVGKKPYPVPVREWTRAKKEIWSSPRRSRRNFSSSRSSRQLVNVPLRTRRLDNARLTDRQRHSGLRTTRKDPSTTRVPGLP
jgi:hypothetical protein